MLPFALVLSRILSGADERLVAHEREWLRRLQLALARFDLTPGDKTALEQSIRQLDELFLIVIVGEFNAGKSAFINALLGRKLLEEGVTPTTTRIHLLTHPDTESAAPREGVAIVTAPLDLLRDLHIVDTPGTNAIFREHEALTTDFVPRADLVLFVTSADRPFTETERAFMQSIREWGKKVVLVINKIDILETSADVQSVEDFVRKSAASLLGFEPEVFTVSARAALRRKTLPAQPGETAVRPRDDHEGASPRPDATQQPVYGNRFDELEAYIVSTLDARERVRLKLLNPVGVGTRLVDLYSRVTSNRLEILKEDVVAIDDIERQLDAYRDDLARDFKYRLSHVDNVLYEFEKRGVAFFDDTLRLARVFDLLNKGRLKADFERHVVADMPRTIERTVGEVIDWMVSSDLRQWQGVMDKIQARRAAHADRIVGEVGGAFSYDRARLLDTVGRAAERAVQSYDHEREASEMAESVRMAVAGTAVAEVGAIGLGAVVTAVASTTFADVTGILAASAVAVIGLFVIPIRRQQAKKTLRDKITGMRSQLVDSLTGQFSKELDRSLARIRDAIAPYTRFVRSEKEQLTNTAAELTEVRRGLDEVKQRIEGAVPVRRRA